MNPTLSQLMRDNLACVVPVWYSPQMPPERMQQLLSRTLADCELFLQPQNTALVLDGCPWVQEPACRAAEEYAQRVGQPPKLLIKETNEGQGGAVCYGFEHFLAETDVPYLCSRDADGDHDIYDLPHLFRLLRTMEQRESSDLVYTLGQRGDLHRPMGFARGEYEPLLNEITVRAVCWAMAPQGATPDLRYCRRLPWPPDFQSGYKAYTRRTAEVFVSSLRKADAADPEARVLRWGIQFISTVELLLAGVAAGSAYRVTYDEQPQTTFENADNRLIAYGQQFVWLYQRLRVPMKVGLGWWDEAMLTTRFATTSGGWEELLAIRKHLGEMVWGTTELPEPPQRRIMF